MATYGKIHFDLACRLGELTANEMRILIYLYAKRNENSLQCNPKRKTICTDTKLGKSNLSRALIALELKGWIAENENGNFHLFAASEIPKKVVDSTTKKVVKVTTKVVESTTESCQSNNTHIKDLEQRKNKEGTEKKTLPISVKKRQTQSEWLVELKEIFNDVDFEREVKKAERWIRLHPPRQFTKKFLSNWLNSADEVIKISTNGNGHYGCPKCKTAENVAAMAGITMKDKTGYILEESRILTCECRKNGST